MEVTIDLWTLLASLLGIFTTFLTLMLAAGKFLLRQFESRLDMRFMGLEKSQKASQNHMDERFSKIESGMVNGNNQLSRLERELLELKAELPTKYVFRDDFVLNQTKIEAKLDGLARKIDDSLLEGGKHG